MVLLPGWAGGTTKHGWGAETEPGRAPVLDLIFLEITAEIWPQSSATPLLVENLGCKKLQ